MRLSRLYLRVDSAVEAIHASVAQRAHDTSCSHSERQTRCQGDTFSQEPASTPARAMKDVVSPASWISCAAFMNMSIIFPGNVTSPPWFRRVLPASRASHRATAPGFSPQSYLRMTGK